MTSEEVINMFETYYGKYKNSLIKKFAKEWLDECGYPLDALIKVVTNEYSANYGRPPDAAMLNKITKQNTDQIKKISGDYETPDGEVYRRGVMIGLYDGDIFIPALYQLKGSAKKEEYVDNYKKYLTPDSFAKLVFEDLPPAIRDKTAERRVNKEAVAGLLEDMAKSKRG